MQSVWQLNHSKHLILFFSGWAMDERPTQHLQIRDSDLCTCYDYSSLNTEEAERWAAYDTVRVAGWSIGIWATE